MRRNTNLRVYIKIFFFLLALMSIPRESTLRIKGMTLATFAPAWEQIQSIHRVLRSVTNVKSLKSGSEVYTKEIQKLKLENLLLKNEIHHLKEVLENEALIESIVPKSDISYLKYLRKEKFQELLFNQLHAIPAKVIYRSPSSWTSFLWINVGHADNKTFSREIIAKNSPVVLGTAVVGVIDYVGNKQSLVRLITDPELTPSVRVLRVDKDKTIYLAKGELKGSIGPEWRKYSTTLKGFGFNYDYPDEEGGVRDLRTGESVFSSNSKMSLIQKGDLLVTTGMDGVFPMGLAVANVSHINLLKEGDYCYEIEAEACVGNLDDLTSLFVLPPSGYRAEKALHKL